MLGPRVSSRLRARLPKSPSASQTFGKVTEPFLHKRSCGVYTRCSAHTEADPPWLLGSPGRASPLPSPGPSSRSGREAQTANDQSQLPAACHRARAHREARPSPSLSCFRWELQVCAACGGSAWFSSGSGRGASAVWGGLDRSSLSGGGGALGGLGRLGSRCVRWQPQKTPEMRYGSQRMRPACPKCQEGLGAFVEEEKQVQVHVLRL